MSRLTTLLFALAMVFATPPALADGASLGARLLPAGSSMVDREGGLSVELALSAPVPWRAYTVADPARLVVELGNFDWRAEDAARLGVAGRAGAPRGVRAAGGAWRLEFALSAPLALGSAEMQTAGPDGQARIALRLDPVDEARFRAASALSPDAAPHIPAPAAGPLVVALDPGHGGVDPGAEGGGHSEAALMLTFARELRAALEAAGFRVVLTRDDDGFVSLDSRITRARAGGAQVFLSLHADALAEGRATGARVYTLSESASDAASAALAERHDRADLLAGVDLTGRDDATAGLLMDLARQETRPRAAALADAIVSALGGEGLGLHKQPRLSAGFSVLRSPDIPSVLIELGFISSKADRARLALPEWRAAAARAIVAALQVWSEADAARLAQLRR